MSKVDDEDGWDRVAIWLEREIEQQGLTLRRIEVEGNVAYRTVQKLLDGQPVARRDALARLATFLGYQADAIDRVRRDESPIPNTASAIDSRGLADISGRVGNLAPDAQREIMEKIAELERQQDS